MAGNTIGGSGSNYSLRTDCIDETLARPNANMSVAPVNQQFSGADGWLAAGGNFVKEQTTTINVDPRRQGPRPALRGLAGGRQRGRRVFIESNKFILI